MLTDESFLRYHRQVQLPEIGEQGQQALQQAKVLIIGAGGLGAPAALYLAGAGVGTLVIADGDRVERSNLQRQIIYRDDHQGESKAQVAVAQVKALNPHIRARAVTANLAKLQLAMEISLADVVLDCTDSFASRHAINQACFEHGKQLISGAAIRWQGQLMSFDFRAKQGPCYHCLFPHGEMQAPQNCSESGIAGPVVGIMGTFQALQAIKAITASGESGTGQFRQFDGLTLQWQQFALPVNPQCPVCSKESL
ncbi:HesA/MoeB/ThiF family protein [Photobacterium galatheae]|uniref:Molybdopterin-synthase adenylyltransferase n=1 Tax=Photobacterium galatheae TaxID=1654360 RepID=A0A066RWN1_9GAMM|nr:HesA/MoeB/ThiF family protein [Photobacterium galatheae]KDM92092.1 molybdopterin-synthase adenylyltransferase [Photobacterium galatheae]MCM0150937.1 HesA/MoeB/ThiF family protein [Photobacterium galatheae]